MSRTFAVSLLFVAAVAAAPGSAQALTTEVTTCGQSIVGGKAVLTQDLDCTGFPIALELQGTKLDLAGHTIRGGATVVRNHRGCKVTSDPPGGRIEAVAGSTSWGLRCKLNVRVSDVDIVGADQSGGGVFSENGKIRADRVNVLNWETGVETWDEVGSIRLTDCDVSDNKVGVTQFYKGVRLRNCTIENNSDYGVHTRKGNVRDSSISGNGWGPPTGITGGISAVAGLNIRDSIVSGNAQTGIWTPKLKAKNTTITLNEIQGVLNNAPLIDNRIINLKDSSATGNGTSADCGVTVACADISSLHQMPRLRGTSICETSYVRLSGIPGTNWGVCTND